MNTNGRWFRSVISGLAISVVALVGLVGASDSSQLMAELGRGPLPIERLVLSGVATAGRYHMASIHDVKSGVADWFVEGEVVFGYKLKEIGTNYVKLVKRGRSTPRV